MPRPGVQENKAERRANYTQWLLGHKSMWHQWDTVSEDGKKAIRHDIVALMKRDGVLAKSTGWRDVAMLAPLLDQLSDEAKASGTNGAN